jgi:hypothetical protein
MVGHLATERRGKDVERAPLVGDVAPVDVAPGQPRLPQHRAGPSTSNVARTRSVSKPSRHRAPQCRTQLLKIPGLDS